MASFPQFVLFLRKILTSLKIPLSLIGFLLKSRKSPHSPPLHLLQPPNQRRPLLLLLVTLPHTCLTTRLDAYRPVPRAVQLLYINKRYRKPSPPLHLQTENVQGQSHLVILISHEDSMFRLGLVLCRERVTAVAGLGLREVYWRELALHATDMGSMEETTSKRELTALLAIPPICL